MSAPLVKHPRFAPPPEATYIECEVPAPPGRVYAAFSDRGVSLVLPAESCEQFEQLYRERFGRDVERVDAADHPELVAALREADATKVECDLDGISAFTRRVLRAAAEIPRGETRSYQWLASRIGMPRAARAVGNALGSNPVPIVIPCHRIVRGDGSIGGYAFGPRMKRALLEVEGALTRSSDRTPSLG